MNRKLVYRHGVLFRQLAAGLFFAVLFSALAISSRNLPAVLCCGVCVLFEGERVFHILLRILRKDDCFAVTPDGISGAAFYLSFGILCVPVSVRIVPWSCIRSFHCEHDGANSGIRLAAADMARFPHGYPRFVRWLLCRESEKHGGAYFGSALSDCDPDALTDELNRLLLLAHSDGIVPQDAAFFAKKE